MGIVPVPELEIDKKLHPSGEIHAIGMIERAVVFGLLLHLERAGFHVEFVYDGDEEYRPKTTKEVMEVCFNLDEVRIFYGKGKERAGSVLLIFGNDGWDCISDWSWVTGDETGFDAAMNKFVPEKSVVLGVTGINE